MSDDALFFYHMSSMDGSIQKQQQQHRLFNSCLDRETSQPVVGLKSAARCGRLAVVAGWRAGSGNDESRASAQRGIRERNRCQCGM